MSKALKWILGVVIALIVVACIAGVGLLAFSRINGIGGMIGTRAFRLFGFGRMMPFRGMPMNPYFGMPYGRFGGFFPLRFIGGSIFCFGILVLIVLGIIALVTALRRQPQPAAVPVQAVSTTQPAPPVSQATEAEAPAPEATPTRACPSCGRQVNEDWSHCPYCGSPLA